MLAFLMPWIAKGQIISIGDVATGSYTYNIPFNSLNNYSFVEQIYTSDEIQRAGGGTGTITTISFYRKPNNLDDRGITDVTSSIVLYMKNVNQATFPDAMSYVRVTADDVVFEGDFVTPTTEGWITITLDTPFNYDVTQNLLVAIDENSDGHNRRYFSCSSIPNSVHSFYSKIHNPDPYNLSPFINGTQAYFGGKYNIVMAYRNNIQLTIVPQGSNICQKPATFECANVTDNSATLTWSEGSGLYNVEYKKTSDMFWTSALTNSENLTTTLTDLHDDTDYQAKIQSVCDGNVLSNWNAIEFHTTCRSITTFPWTEDFNDLYEGSIPSCWDNNDGTTIMVDFSSPTLLYWCFTNGQQGHGNALGTGHDGSKCVRFDSFYNVLGSTNFLKTPVLDFPESTLMLLDFWYKNPTGGDLSVYISTDSGETYPDILVSNLPNQTEWTEVQIELNDYVGAQNVVIVFGGISNYGNGDAYIYLDDITIKGFALTKDIVHYTENKNDHYHLIASPIETIAPEQVAGMLDNKFDLYYFDQTQPKEWINYWSNDFSLVPGKGYLYANSEDVTLTFTGLPYRGDGKVTLVKSDDYKLPGVNLVGNPFPDTAYVDRNFYVLNANGTELEAANRSYVEAMEGIFVYATEDGEVLTFRRKAPAKGAQLSLNLSGPSDGSGAAIIDRAIIRFDEKGMLPKFQIDDNNTKLYITQDNIDCAVVHCEGKGELPVSFKAENDGSYTLSFQAENISFAYLHLIDDLTGEDVDLLETPNYTFEAKTADHANRFKLVFTCEDTNVNNTKPQ